MATAEPATTSEIAVFRHQAGMIRAVVRMNLEGVDQEDSLVQPPSGNCLNWVVGHLLAIYGNVLPLLGQEPAMEKGALARYDRGSAPMQDPGDALELRDLLAAWDVACERFDAGLASLAPEALDRPAPFSPSGNPDETVRSLVSTVLFHQAYHAGQTGILRRIAGKEGAIR